MKARLLAGLALLLPSPALADTPAELPRLGLGLSVLKKQADMPGGIYIESAAGPALLAGYCSASSSC